MVSLCMSLWKPCKDTWGTKSLLTSPGKHCSSHEAPSSVLENRAPFPAWWGTRPGVCGQLGSSLPRPREPCTSGIISLVITCLTRRLRGFNEIMFVKLFELLGRINGTIEMQNIIIRVITEAFTLVPDEEEKP